jgi:hypothetical protein
VGGELEVIQSSDLSQDEAAEFGALVGFGFGGGEEDEALAVAEAGAEAGADGHIFGDTEVWYLSDAVPEGTSAAIAHLWAIPLRDKILRAGGTTLADEWIHPADLIAVGAAASAALAGAES